MRLLIGAAVVGLLAGVLPLQRGTAGVAANGGSFANDGARLLANPTGARYVTASVNSLVADIPRGKIYVGGDLSGVSDASTSINRMNLARLNSDGTVDASFVVTTADEVRTMLLVGDSLYVGGDFSNDGTEDSRDGTGSFRSSRLLRVDQTTDAIDRTWVPSGHSNTYATAYVTGTTNVLVAGMSGSGYLKVLNVITGSTVMTVSDFDDTVRALVWDGNYLYVGGEQFGTNGKPDYLRRYTYDGATFTYDAVWQPTVANSGLFDDWVRVMLIHDGYLYVAGEFNNPGGNGEHEALVRIPLTSTTGVIDPDWIPGIESNIYALAVSGNILYTGGNDNEFHIAMRFVLGAGTPVRDLDFNPAHSYAQTTGIPAAPSAGDYEDVLAILPLTTTVLYGGDFATVNGVSRPGGLAMVSSAASTVPDAPTMNAPTGSGRGPYTFSGTAQQGVRVTLYDGEAVVSSTVAAAGGVWSFTTSSNLAVGEHIFVARTQPIYEIGLPTLLPTADSAFYTLTIGGASNAVGATYALTFAGAGQDGALKILQDGGADLINVYDPTSLSPKDSTNSRSLTTTGAAPVNTAQLIVMGYDIDWPTGEWDYVYLNGRELGRLSGTSNTWNATVLDIPDLSWVNDGVNTLQFKVTAYGETHLDHWTANIAGVTLLIDGGAGDRGELQSLAAPLPVSGVAQPTVVFTTATETQFRVELQLVDPNGDTVASNQSADVSLTIDERYTVTVPITYVVASYTGYSVRAMLYAQVDTVWVPQGSLQTYFDVPTTVVKDGAGDGTVTSTPAGISCGVTCTEYFDYATVLTYTAVPTSGSRFTGWGGACSGTGPCVVTLTAEFVVTATFEPKATDAYLTALNLSVGALSPAFVSTTTSYTVSASYGTTRTVVTPTLSDSNAAYTITGPLGVCGSGTCALQSGVNVVTVTVTAENGSTIEEYTVEITVAPPSSNANLALLGSTFGSVDPTFVSGTVMYTLEIPYGWTSIVVFATPDDANATYVISSTAGACSNGICDVKTSGATAITVTVTAQDGVTKKTYVVLVSPADPSSDASLSSLEIDPGTLMPEFVSTTTKYTGSVPVWTASVRVTTTANSPDARVAYVSSAGVCDDGFQRGVSVARGDIAFTAANCAVSITETTRITATVTAQDGTVQEYVIVIVHDLPPPADASLLNLEIDPGTLLPAFVSSTLRYEAAVPNGTTQVLVTATTSDATALLAYASSAGGCQGAYCSVAGPKTWITATVTSGSTAARYVKFVSLSEAGNRGLWASAAELGVIDPNSYVLAKSGWSVFECSSAHVEGPCSNAIDGDVSTIWHTDYPIMPGFPYTIAVDMGAVHQVSGLTYLPRQIGSNGNVGAYEVYISMDGATWTKVSDGTFADGADLQTVRWGAATREYSIEITVAGLTTIDRVWPGTGLPEGGMPVQIFGSGFAAALTVTVGPYTDGLMIDVPFVIANDGQIDFVMPAGVAGQRVNVTVQMAESVQTAVDAFAYVEPDVIEVDGETGGVFTTTDGVVVTIPPQGVTGSFFITMTPLPPASEVPGNVLMYSFRLDAVLNGTPLATLTNPVTIRLPIDEGIFAIADGERPWLYQWTTDDGRPTSIVVCRPSSVVCRPWSVVGFWTLVRGQEYDPGTQVMTVALRPMGVYALSTLRLRAYWFPTVSMMK